MLKFDIRDDLLQHVPVMNIEFDGARIHENGLDLPVIAISLQRRADRWTALSARMEAIGLDKMIKAPAVDGSSLPDDLIATLLGSPNKRLDGAPRDHFALTRPAIGCSMSHLGVWRWMLAENIPRAIVFEDDAAPSQHFDPIRFRELASSVPADAGLVFLGSIIMDGLAERTEKRSFARLYYFNGTFAYLITREACRFLLRHLLPLRSHIDHQISRVLVEQRHAFAAWRAEPSFFEPDWSLGSDCYVPLGDETAADRELGEVLAASRRILLSEGRPLLQAFGG